MWRHRDADGVSAVFQESTLPQNSAVQIPRKASQQICLAMQCMSIFRRKLVAGSQEDQDNYLCVIACKHLQRNWSNELANKVKPYILEINLLHVNIISWDIFITTRYTAILETNINTTRQFILSSYFFQSRTITHNKVNSCLIMVCHLFQ